MYSYSNYRKKVITDFLIKKNLDMGLYPTLESICKQIDLEFLDYQNNKSLIGRQFTVGNNVPATVDWATKLLSYSNIEQNTIIEFVKYLTSIEIYIKDKLDNQLPMLKSVIKTLREDIKIMKNNFIPVTNGYTITSINSSNIDYNKSNVRLINGTFYPSIDYNSYKNVPIKSLIYITLDNFTSFTLNENGVNIKVPDGQTYGLIGYKISLTNENYISNISFNKGNEHIGVSVYAIVNGQNVRLTEEKHYYSNENNVNISFFSTKTSTIVLNIRTFDKSNDAFVVEIEDFNVNYFDINSNSTLFTKEIILNNKFNRVGISLNTNDRENISGFISTDGGSLWIEVPIAAANSNIETYMENIQIDPSYTIEEANIDSTIVNSLTFFETHALNYNLPSTEYVKSYNYILMRKDIDNYDVDGYVYIPADVTVQFNSLIYIDNKEYKNETVTLKNGIHRIHYDFGLESLVSEFPNDAIWSKILSHYITPTNFSRTSSDYTIYDNKIIVNTFNLYEAIHIVKYDITTNDIDNLPNKFILKLNIKDNTTIKDIGVVTR